MFIEQFDRSFIHSLMLRVLASLQSFISIVLKILVSLVWNIGKEHIQALQSYHREYFLVAPADELVLDHVQNILVDQILQLVLIRGALDDICQDKDSLLLVLCRVVVLGPSYLLNYVNHDVGWRLQE